MQEEMKLILESLTRDNHIVNNLCEVAGFVENLKEDNQSIKIDIEYCRWSYSTRLGR